MNIKSICFIVPNYPYYNDPTHTFIKELVSKICDIGIKCTVIAPQSLSKVINKKNSLRPAYWQDETFLGNKIDVYQPKFISISKIKIRGNSISSLLFDWSVEKCFYKNNIKTDVIYSHFWNTSVVARKIGNKYQLPVFIATGESTIWIDQVYNEFNTNNNLNTISGVISVSSKNLNESKKLNLIQNTDTIVIPNGVDLKKFKILETYETRLKLGINKDDFVVAFTGAFSERKGVKRLLESIKNLNGVKVILIGKGELGYNGDEIIFSGQLEHEEVPKYLNCADIFALPTLAEGCSNAIVEALACGLPVISSNLPFNDDILDDKNSIRINPDSISELSEAIDYLKRNKNIRDNMSKNALNTAKKLSIDNRALNIISFINEKVK